MLVEDTSHTFKPNLSTSKGEESPEHRTKIYHSLVLRGKLRSEVWWITDRDKGGLFQPEETCPKTGLPILDVLRSKQPETFPLSAHSL